MQQLCGVKTLPTTTATTTATTTTKCSLTQFRFGHCNFSTTTTTTASTGCAEDDYYCGDYAAQGHDEDLYPDKSEYDDDSTATPTTTYTTTTSPTTTTTRVPK